MGGQVMLGHVRPNLLGGFTIEGMEIKGTRVARKLAVSPKPWDVFRGSLGFGFHAELVSGMTDGHMMFPFRKEKTPMNVTVNMTDVDLAGFSGIFPPRMTPKAVITGELNLTTLRNSLDKATGNLALSWKKGTLPLGMVTLPFDALVFENLDFDGKIDKGLLNIEKADLAGEFSGTMRGNIRFSSILKRSRLSIMGELNLPESIKKSLGPLYDSSGQGNRFSLRGTIERPRFRMLGAGMRQIPSMPAQGVSPGAQPQPQPASPERRAAERARQDMAQPVQPPASMERSLPEKTIPDDMQDEKDLEEEGQ
jgi:type II secretion system protein N